jgi:hypothetical protein
MDMEQLSPDAPQPDLMGEDGLIKLLPTSDYDAFDRAGLRLWCHHHARYGLPTQELVAWLRDYIGNRLTIEIGAGAGDLAHHLGIAATDSKIQDDPRAARFYDLMKTPRIAYPHWVEKLDALAAIKRYRPAIVIGSWITHWIDPNKPPPKGGGSMFGVREDRLLRIGVTYVFIGNMVVHQHKPILKLPHLELALPFLRSRARHPEYNRVLIWNA